MRVWVGNPEVWALGDIPWQFFCSLTFRGIKLANPSHRAGVIRVTLWFTLYRRFCRRFGIADSRLVWCLRQEAGEKGGRMHLHALIGGVPRALVNERTCLWLMHQWSSDDQMRQGWARVRVYDAALPGVDYACKGLVTADVSAANAYESCKFRDSDQIMVSKSTVRLLSALRRSVGLLAN